MFTNITIIYTATICILQMTKTSHKLITVSESQIEHSGNTCNLV